MPLLRLIAEGVGPFEKLDIDFSDGHGEPHLGPHILAGVNGSGKSTILRTIAWVMDGGWQGFQYDDWLQVLKGYPHSRALVVIRPSRLSPYVLACSKGGGDDVKFVEWTRATVRALGLESRTLPTAKHVRDLTSAGVRALWAQAEPTRTPPDSMWLRFPQDDETGSSGALFNIAAYSPSKALRHLAHPDLTKTLSSTDPNCLAFESTVQNDAIQAWLLSLYSKRAIARERQQSGNEYTKSLERFERALRLVYGQNVSFEVEIEPTFQPRLRVMGRSLNFSQLPDGIRSTVAWIADFMMRQDLVRWDSRARDTRPGVLLLDEVDAHLHPQWQRVLLPAMREALPNVQMIVSSHSPFVISSCPGSRVHVLELDDAGRAHAKAPVDSPIGESVTTTLKEIFGVDSRFDVLTERQLNRWNDLKRSEATDSLSAPENAEFQKLTEELSERSEELRSIVASEANVPKRVLESLRKKRRVS